ncbi:unnamed protein product [Symbiodinium necroappetens]|uniref:Uncharacterized protein n=1 Tax=Symbiodinium necroappetens TaxID=1628268 RepID=A0A812P7R4_9DINO|nr:unnamed protein product [Symbiodinium necroappetens]
MSLSLLLFLNLLARAFAWARVAATFEAAAGRNASLAEHLEGLEGLQPRPGFKGGLQLLGACCGEQRQKALEVETSINSNTLYGSTKEIAEVLFNASACAPVPETDRGQKAKAGCAYVAIFANTEFADNEYAANCVPAQVCKDDVLGRTKGLIATYGVLLQTMQENLGSLVYLSESPISRCYEGRDQINLGNLQSLLVEKELRLEDEEGAVLGSEMVMEIPGMESLGSQESLLPCKDDPSLGYLYVHRNRYWSSEKQAVDLAAFELRQSRSLPKIQKKAQLRAKALKEVSENSAEEPKPKAELQVLERIDAVAPEALGVKAPRGSEPKKAQTAEKEAEALKVEAAVAPKHVQLGAGAATLASPPGSAASPHHPVVLGQRYHSNWNLPSISPVHCTCGRRCAKGRILGLWNYWCFRYECNKCPPIVHALTLGH